MSITRHALPSGATVDLRDPQEVVERYKRPIRTLQMALARDPAFAGVVETAKEQGIKAISDIGEAQAADMATQMGANTMDLMDQLSDRVIISRVVGWSFDADVCLDALLDLTSGDYEKLKELTAKGALDGGSDFSPSIDEDSPPVPSIASV